MVRTSPDSWTNPGLAPAGLLTFRARVILTLMTDWPIHLLFKAAKLAASSMSSSFGVDESLTRMTCEPEHPDA